MTTLLRPAFTATVVLALAIGASAWIAAQTSAPKQAIAHRGASAYAPEHTAAVRSRGTTPLHRRSFQAAAYQELGALA